MAKMTDNEVLAICKAQINGALGFLNGKLAQARLKALQYYNAEPYGNEVEGSSQIVTTEGRIAITRVRRSLVRFEHGLHVLDPLDGERA